MVSKDGAMTYSSVASLAHPEAIQISDRFHLIKTLSEAVQKYIIGRIPLPCKDTGRKINIRRNESSL